MQWEENLEQKMAALEPEEISAALRRHIDPKNLVIVNAGDFDAAAKPDPNKPTPGF
jgi:predicted Zn-dependent peptidase